MLFTNTYSYKYDDNGIRTQKTINGITTHYTTVDGRITGQYDGTNTIYFRYNAENSLIGFNLNGTEYIYLKNIQGDIEGILDPSGNLVVQYTYDAWGKVLSVTGEFASTVGIINPMRYRGYYFDSETGYYYLQSRYYNPEFCRFINADEPSMMLLNIENIVGVNLFAYCNNNSVNFLDSTGAASYKNTIKYKDDYYSITTTITVFGCKIKLKYSMTKTGIVRFGFHDTNNYYLFLICTGAARTLAEAIYKAAKSKSKQFLWGRTIGGLHTELQLHYLAYFLNIKKENSKVADMGSLISSKPGYDSNAWFFESSNAVRILANYVIWREWAMYGMIRNIARYF